MTTAQTVFAIALGIITLIILAFAVYVVSSTMWGDRWVPNKKVKKSEES